LPGDLESGAFDQKKIFLMKELIYKSSKIAYLSLGQGNPIVLLHGFCEDHRIWDSQIGYLENQGRLIVPDLPGSGLSDAVEDMSLEGIAACLDYILDHEFPNRSKLSQHGNEMNLVGHSMGGYLALAMVEKKPENFGGLGLFHSTAYPDTEEKKVNRKKSIEFIKMHGARPFVRQTTPNLFSASYKNEFPGRMESLIERYADFKPASLISYYEAMIRRPDRTSVLKNFRGKILFIIGEEDLAVPMSEGLRQCHLPQCSHIHIFENTAHMGMLENSAKSNQALKEFIHS
jgi:pimeloyl-ACP methyl ester carboxylesterase